MGNGRQLLDRRRGDGGMSGPAGDVPVQAWAHREGLVHLEPLAPAAWTPGTGAARLQIAEAFSRFAIGHDEARVDVLMSCFTADGVLQVAQGHAEPFAVHHGRTAIGAELGRIIGQQADQRRHLISNIVVERLDATTARALAYGLVSGVGASYGLRLGASVIYVADLAREADGCWRFTSFFIGMDAYAGDKPAPQPLLPGNGLPGGDELDEVALAVREPGHAGARPRRVGRRHPRRRARRDEPVIGAIQVGDLEGEVTQAPGQGGLGRIRGLDARDRALAL